MMQSPVQCLGCRKCEEHSNAQMLLPCPHIRQIDSNALMTSALSVNQKHVTALQKGSNVNQRQTINPRVNANNVTK